MPRVHTKFFGECDYDAADIFSFPDGIPGFEDQQSFLFLNGADAEPLLFLQSISTWSLCFVLLPILVADPEYRIDLTAEETSQLGLPDDRTPVIGEDILCAALVCAGTGEPTANLMSPIVVNLRNRTGMQVIHAESGYSHRYPLHFEEPVLAC